jgi:hypothetical protein
VKRSIFVVNGKKDAGNIVYNGEVSIERVKEKEKSA